MNGYKPQLTGLKPNDVEPFIGIEGYASRTPGLGGVVKERPEDFLTWETLLNGLDARKAYKSQGFVEGVGGLLLAVLWKKGIDTIRASTAIAHTLGVKPSLLSFCGIKDKMSVSWQFITLPRSLTSPGEALEIGNVIRVKPLRPYGRRLSSRDLAYNNFEITIRYVEADVGVLKECLRQLTTQGLPNFYGHQRFGVTRPITPIVGRLIMEDRLEEAVSAFLADYSPLENQGNREARKRLLETWDLDWASRNFPHSLRYEREIIRYLLENPGDYVGALRSLPLRLRRLLVESVAALIFNKTLSRLLLEGESLREPEIGDIVLPIGFGGRPEKGRAIRVRASNLNQVRRLVGEGKLVTALPVPGYLTEIPRSNKGDSLEESLKELGVELKMFRVRLLPEASTRGSLRPLVTPSWSCRTLHIEPNQLTLGIRLPPGSYATILLREIMKPETPLSYIGSKTPNSRGGGDDVNR